MSEAMESTMTRSPDLTEASPRTRSTAQPQPKPIHSIVLDSSPLLLNTPPLSTLISHSDTLVTLPSVISEIRDVDARSRIENLYLPFLKLRSPKAESIKFVRDFTRKTGDAVVLSGTDIEVLALAYELECDRNGGDWRLRRAPGQERINGSKPDGLKEGLEGAARSNEEAVEAKAVHDVAEKVQRVSLSEGSRKTSPCTKESSSLGLPEERSQQSMPDRNSISSDSASDSEGWITPSNIKKHQAKDSNLLPTTKKSEQKTLQVATITGDFAMQNVLLQMNLNLLSPKTCKRVTQLKQTILRCHGCFSTTKEMEKQFCPRCGKPTLTRVSCTTNQRGETKLHLKTNMQWNNRGNVYSIPKPASGRSNQKWAGPRDGGGKNGWGRELVLAEDQKEYIRAITNSGAQKSRKEKDLMDENYLPGILTGERSGGRGRIGCGARRNINARKR